METAILQFFENLRSGALNSIFVFFTFFGENTFIVLAICLIYWTVNKYAGEFLLMNVFSSVSVNCLLKGSIKRLRPYKQSVVSKVEYNGILVDSTGLDHSYSFPSGHSQAAGSLFSSFVFLFQKKITYIVCGLFLFFVMLSRVYLGVHYPSDVLTGAFLGILITFFWIYVFNKHYEKRYYIFLIISLSLSISLFFIETDNLFKAIGGMTGAAFGLILENKYINFKMNITIYKKILRFVLGIGYILAVRLGFKALFPEVLILTYLRYFIIIFSATYIYPLIFKKLNF
jgi:membrane-associated phospholipid phosphatase